MTLHTARLYSFLRCPYAMRARMALHVAAIPHETIEVNLKNKPPEMLAISPKGTVPVLQLTDGRVLEESLDIMRYALTQHDPENWLPTESEREACEQFIMQNDKVFKTHLDRYKYHTRYPEANRETHHLEGEKILANIDARIARHNGYLLAARLTLADIAIFPFIRQWASVEGGNLQAFEHLEAWLRARTDSALFHAIMH
jgi:glutathione S-transferase